MTIPLTYTGLQTELAAIVARVPAPWTNLDAAFVQLFPRAVSYGEQRISSDMPWLAQHAQDTSLITVAEQRAYSLQGTKPFGGTVLPCIVPERIALIVPAGAGIGNGTMIQAIPVSLDFIDMFWPQQGAAMSPSASPILYWANQGGFSPTDFISPTIVIAPTVDAAYTIVVTGLFQQQTLQVTPFQTYISTLYPELLVAACMVFLSGALLRNYGSSGTPGAPAPDEPGQPVHWESQYQALLSAARAEEARRRQQGTDWLYRPPMPPVAAQPPVRAPR